MAFKSLLSVAQGVISRNFEHPAVPPAEILHCPPIKLKFSKQSRKRTLSTKSALYCRKRARDPRRRYPRKPPDARLTARTSRNREWNRGDCSRRNRRRIAHYRWNGESGPRWFHPSFQTSICSAMVNASSTSTPRYRTVLSILVWPSRSWTARRLPVFL